MEFSVSTKISLSKYSILLVEKCRQTIIHCKHPCFFTEFSPQKTGLHQASSANVRSIDLSCQLSFLGSTGSPNKRFQHPEMMWAEQKHVCFFREKMKKTNGAWLIDFCNCTSGLCLDGKLWTNCFDFWVVFLSSELHQASPTVFLVFLFERFLRQMHVWQRIVCKNPRPTKVPYLLAHGSS